MLLQRVVTMTCIQVIMLSIATAQQSGKIPQLASDISPLLIGEKTPDLSVQNTNNEEVRIQALFASKPTVLIFYRGGWCPYCNLHLVELQGIEKEILKAGYQIVAINVTANANRFLE